MNYLLLVYLYLLKFTATDSSRTGRTTDTDQWRIQDFKKEGSTSTQMHSQGLPDSCAQQFS